MLPRPNTDDVRRVARSRRIVLRSDEGWRVCAATLTASYPYTGSSMTGR